MRPFADRVLRAGFVLVLVAGLFGLATGAGAQDGTLDGGLEGVLEGAVGEALGGVTVGTQDATPADAGATGPDAAAAQLAAAGAPDTTGGIDYAAWEDFASRVEGALESGKVSDSVLGDLRRDLVDARATFAAAKDENSVRIQALRAQLAALGAPPGDGSEELAGTAAQRKALETELDAVLAPITRATLAYTRAETLISTLDQSLRSRQVRDVSAAGPSPFDVSTWLPALETAQRTFRLAWKSAIGSWSNATQRKTLVAQLPLTLPLGTVGMVLLVFGWRTVRRIGERLRAGKSTPVRGAWGFVISALQVWVPSFGALLLGAALSNAFVLDSRGEQIISAFIAIVTVQFIARWIGNRVFGIPGAGWRVLDLPDNQVRFAHAIVASLGVLIGLQMLLGDLGRIDGYSDATLAVLGFPLILVTGMVLWRLGQLMRHYGREAREDAEDDDRPTSFYNNTVRMLGLLAVLVAFIAPVAAAVGYRQLATFALYPSINSLALIAVLMILHHFIIDIFALVARRDREEASQSLVPVLISVGIAIAAVPLLPLIWGYRVSDLTEFWDKIWGGIALGEAVITPTTVLTVAVVFGIGYAATRLVQGMLSATILPKTGMEPGGQVALTSGVGYIGIFIAVVAAVTAAGIDLSSLAIVAGALSVGIGFGLQTIVSNFVSGIILLIERPIGKGDWIEVGTTMGIVKDISVRSTTIETFDRTDVIVPNSDLIAGTVTNYTRGNLLGRVILTVGVAYGTDTKKVERILREIAEAHPLVTVNPPPRVVFQGFGADSLDFDVRVILRDVFLTLDVRTDINHEIARRFAEEGIEIPFAQRDIWLRNPEALTPGAAPAPTAPEDPVDPREEPPAAEQEPSAEGPQLEAEDMHNTLGYGPEDGEDD